MTEPRWTAGGWDAPALPAPLRVPMAVAAALAVLAVAVLAAGHYRDSGPDWFDAWLTPAMRDVGAPAFRLALVIDFAGEPGGSAILMAGVVLALLAAGRRRAAVVAVAGSGAAVTATTLLKPVVGRRIHEVYHAFPSGHTALATALALVVGLVLADRLRLGRPAGTLLALTAAVLAAAAMAWSEVVLDAHYPTDAVGGCCTAVALVAATAWLVDRTADALLNR